MKGTNITQKLGVNQQYLHTPDKYQWNVRQNLYFSIMIFFMLDNYRQNERNDYAYGRKKLAKNKKNKGKLEGVLRERLIQ